MNKEGLFGLEEAQSLPLPPRGDVNTPMAGALRGHPEHPRALVKRSQARLAVQGEGGHLQPLTESCRPHWREKVHRPC